MPASEATDFRELFPYAAPLVAPREEKLLISPVEVSGPEILAFGKPVAIFDLIVDAEFSADAVASNALISFSLIAADGSPIDVSALGRTGIAKSTNPDIGFYRYLETRPGRSEIPYSVALPAGVYCEGVTVMRFKKLDTTMTLHSIVAAIR